MRLRPILALLTVPVLAAGLVACSSEAQQTPDVEGTDTPVACSPSGPVSDSIEVTGDFGTEPQTTMRAPLSVPALQRTVLIQGTGAELQDDAVALIHFSLYNGSTGELIVATPYDESGLFTAAVSPGQSPAGLASTLRCATVGSRLVGVLPPDAAYGDDGNPNLGIDPGETLVFVIDVVDVVKTQAEGAETPLPEGFPQVTWADDGQPTVTIPDAAPPADLRIATVITGDGPVVTAGESVTVQYQGVNWTSGEVFDESWGRGPATFTTDGVIAGFGAAMVGQTVGSRVVVIIPPDQGYGPSGGMPAAGIAADDTLVFVIDILNSSGT